MTITGPEKYITVDGEEYLTISQACDYLGGITSQTLRTRTRAAGIEQFHQLIAPNVVYYKKKDLENMRRMRPVKKR